MNNQDPDKPFSDAAHRSPKAVSDAIKNIIKGKLVCELGAGNGDNMVFMARYAKEVIGFEYVAARYKIAHARGLNVIVGDYHKEPIPKADVYYYWPSRALTDNEFLMRKILSDKNFKGTIVMAADSTSPAEFQEVSEVERCVKIANGKIMRVPYNEGPKKRMSGVMVLGIINAKTASL